MKKILQVFLLSLLGLTTLVVAQNEEPCVAQPWNNLTVNEGSTAIFRCPVSCNVDAVEWFEFQGEAKQQLKDSRVEIFAFDPLLMYMTDIQRGDQGWYGCEAVSTTGRIEAKVHLAVLKVAGFEAPKPVASVLESAEEIRLQSAPPPPVNNRNVAVQMSTAVLTPVTDSPPETTTTTTTTARSNKWARFQVYSKYRGSRVSYPGAGFGPAYRDALAADNITLIPRREEDMLTTTTTSTTTRKPYWIKTTTTARPLLITPPQPSYPPPPPPPSPEQGPAQTSSGREPFSLYYDMNSNSNARGNYGDNGNAWSQGGKNTIPSSNFGAQLTNRDHLEAIHEHLRYIYDRLDDLLDRVHYLESKE